MAELSVPRWLMTNRCMPGGRRYGKRPIQVDAESKSWSQKLFAGREVTEIKTPFYPAEVRGLFEGWEYRFWAADLSNPMAAVMECRVCKALFSNNQNEARKKHLSEMGCAKQICAAYKLLLKDMVCVICNQKTSKEKWGIPICGSGCMEAWCTCESQPEALTVALNLARTELII